MGCHTIGVAPTSRLFRSFYFLKTREEFYFLQSREKPIVIKLLDTNKGWKPLFIRITAPIGVGVGVDLQWQVAKAAGNKAHWRSVHHRSRGGRRVRRKVLPSRKVLLKPNKRLDLRLPPVQERWKKEDGGAC